MPQPDDPERITRAYLAAMESRDLDAARTHLGPGFAMHFPGAAPMCDPSELVAWSASRYRRIAKEYEGTDLCDGGAVVYLRGTLAGEWPDGTPFAGIRFVDRFALEGGRIVRQDVWNDMGEARP